MAVCPARAGSRGQKKSWRARDLASGPPLRRRGILCACRRADDSETPIAARILTSVWSFLKGPSGQETDWSVTAFAPVLRSRLGGPGALTGSIGRRRSTHARWPAEPNGLPPKPAAGYRATDVDTTGELMAKLDLAVDACKTYAGLRGPIAAPGLAEGSSDAAVGVSRRNAEVGIGARP